MHCNAHNTDQNTWTCHCWWFRPLQEKEMRHHIASNPERKETTSKSGFVSQTARRSIYNCRLWNISVECFCFSFLYPSMHFPYPPHPHPPTPTFFWQTNYLSLPSSTLFLLDHEMSSPPIWCFSNRLGEVCGGRTDIMLLYFRAAFRLLKVTATASLHSVRLTHKTPIESNVNVTALSDHRTHEIQFSAQSQAWCDKLQTLSREGFLHQRDRHVKNVNRVFFVPRLNSAKRTRRRPRPNDWKAEAVWVPAMLL